MIIYRAAIVLVLAAITGLHSWPHAQCVTVQRGSPAYVYTCPERV